VRFEMTRTRLHTVAGIRAQKMAQEWQVMLDGYRDDLSRFQKQFPTDEKPIPNLRWFDDHVEGADAQEDVEL